MTFNDHSDLEGQHAFLGASKHAWTNYDEEKLVQAYLKQQATQKGTRLHDFACECILLGERLPKVRKTLNMYVNDAIGYKMEPEVILRYSNNSFGKCDSISYRQKKLRIHDLKTGMEKTSFQQLLIYAAYFCLEYSIDPNDISTELRIYQNNDIRIEEPPPGHILRIMSTTMHFDSIIDRIQHGE